jgi:hypothetical protein
MTLAIPFQMVQSLMYARHYDHKSFVVLQVGYHIADSIGLKR